MKRAYKYRFYPTTEQVELLAQTFGCVRFVYNSILRWRTDAYYERKEKIGYLQANARLTALKKEPEYAWLNDVSCVPYSSLCDTNKRPSLTSSPDVLHIRLSKANGTSRRLSSLRARLNTVTANYIWQRASRRWTFAGAVSYLLRHQPLPFPKIALADTLFPACVNLNLYQCLLSLKLSALMLA